MKLEISKFELENILIKSQAFLEKKDLSLITSHVYLHNDNGTFTCKATDYEIGIKLKTDKITSINDGITTCNGKRLLDIIKSIKDENVTLELIQNNLHVKGKNSSFKLPVFDASEFPDFPTIENKPKFEIESKALIEAFKKSFPTIDTNNPKFELNGALIDIKEEKINIVSTDTRRLSIIPIPNTKTANSQLIIPKKAINEINKFEFNSIYYGDNAMVLVGHEFEFFTKLINGKFPDYERIIPKDENTILALSKEEILENLKPILSIANEVKMTFRSGGIEFESLNDDNIEAKTNFDFPLSNIEKEITIALNARYLVDFLSVIKGNEFTLSYNDNSMPFILKNEEHMVIVMPIII